MSRTRYALIVLTHALLIAFVMVALCAAVFAFVASHYGYADPMTLEAYPLAFLAVVAGVSGLCGLAVGIEQADFVARYEGGAR